MVLALLRAQTLCVEEALLASWQVVVIELKVCGRDCFLTVDSLLATVGCCYTQILVSQNMPAETLLMVEAMHHESSF